ncbi:MAG TPA: cation diffusion facilitator family transporter [Xanthobacteraceae bacterium]|nr:cation diffusion facilitator family transporter [Xanthobacteraceae bacterium]
MASSKHTVALISIVASAGLTAAKAIVGLATGSLAILSEAAHSLIDLAATVMTYFALRVADKPADAEHHYGHGKVESLSALAETALLFVLSGVVVWEAGRRLLGFEGAAVAATLPAFVVMAVSIVVDFLRSRALYRAASAHRSEALEADALHFGSDMWSSAAVLVGLAGLRLGFAWADSAAAVVVALFVCLAGWRLGRRTIDTLTDTAPVGAAERIAVLARRVPGVVEVGRVRARQVGAKLFVDLEVDASRTLPLDRVVALKSEIAREITAAMPEVELNAVVSPRALDDETVLERVMVIARNRALAVHHVTVQAVGGKLAVSLDLEVDGALTLAAAHEIASGLESAVRDELGPDVEVESHIEPLQMHGLAGHDAPPARVEAVRAALAAVAAQDGALRDIHDVRVRETSDGEIVNFHCDVDPTMRVGEVHEKVDVLERGLRARFPEIQRVIGHAEPR